MEALHDAVHARPARRDRYGRHVPARFDTVLVNDGTGGPAGVQGKCILHYSSHHSLTVCRVPCWSTTTCIQAIGSCSQAAYPRRDRSWSSCLCRVVLPIYPARSCTWHVQSCAGTGSAALTYCKCCGGQEHPLVLSSLSSNHQA